MTKVKIYSTSWCAFCKAEKEYLDAHGVKYEDVNVEEDEAAAKEMIYKSGQMGVPVTVITHEDNSEEVRVGYDQPWLKQQLKLS